LIAGGVFWVLAFHFSSGKDYSQEDTVGVITAYGWPFKGMFAAPGYAWTQFDGAACELDYWIFVGFTSVTLVLLQFWKFRTASRNR
jgi:hypothetical protein